MTLSVDVRDHGQNIVSIDVQGEITFENSDVLRNKINELCEIGQTKIIIDLAGLKYMSSAGMGVLVHGLKKTRQGAGDLYIVNLNSKMRRVFLITQFTHHFTVFQDMDEALKSFACKAEGDKPFPSKN